MEFHGFGGRVCLGTLFRRFADRGINRRLCRSRVVHRDFCLPDGQSLSRSNVRFTHSIMMDEYAILGIQIAHDENISNLVNLTMPVAGPRVR